MNRKNIQLLLALVILVLGIRLAYILYQRHEEAKASPYHATTAKPTLFPDDYVYLPPSNVYDARSARHLVGKTVWVRLGYSSPAYPVAGGRVLPRSPLALAPLTRLRIQGVLRQAWQGSRAIFVTFAYRGGEHAVEIGIEAPDGSATMQVDSLFFMANPHRLYHDWSAKVWQLIAQHQVMAGMTDTQAMLALGGAQTISMSSNRQTFLFPGVHPPLEVTFKHRRVVGFHAAKRQPKS